MQFNALTAHELHDKLVKKEVSSAEITEAVFKRIDDVEEKVRSLVTQTRDKAMKKAGEVDAKIGRGEAIGPLEGIPVVIKDNMCTEGVLTTCSSKMLHNFVPPYNATVVEKLNRAGAVIIGKANMDEFAMGSSTENSRFFITRNPWDTERVPGGSSGGSAAAVAADETIYSLGSDTGGSIRQPASFCGVVGLKPTYGAVSRYGLIAFASSLDQIGPFTKDVRDCAQVFSTIAGHDPKDSTSAEFAVPDYTSVLSGSVRDLKIGIPREYFVEGTAPKIKELINNAINKFTELGAVCEETSLPHTEYALPVYYIIAPAEASSNLARYDGVRYGYRDELAEDIVTMYRRTRSEGFGTEVKRRIMLGTYALSSGYYDAYYLKALKVRTLIKQDFDKAFEKYDILISPTSPTPAFKFGEKADDPMQMYLTDVFTISVNLAGIPGITLPCGFVDGLPVGLQLMGRPFGEGDLFKAAYAFEQNTGFHLNKPKL
ncbi:Asp-tRNA(Asn)/Glu-tRNA(Gln) amidotransferase subunit GatA [Phosphitispora sp. TUW77]|uniref:Asp-tRNA(Asn)/Glu-tRNA(Gln) amidotransferase subunit GatA n=1 Tax=Phosphitispora sp. TUW77 TaxID=3152361 RepID=UPI003AB49D1A